MSTGMRRWMEKDCPDVLTLSAEVSIDREELRRLREELRRLREELAQYKNMCDELRTHIEKMENQEPVAWCDTNETGPFVEGRLHRKTKRAAELLHRDIDALLVTTPETKS